MNDLQTKKTPAVIRMPRRLRLREALAALGIAIPDQIQREHLQSAHQIFRQARGGSVEVNTLWNFIKRHICRICDGVKLSPEQDTCSLVCKFKARGVARLSDVQARKVRARRLPPALALALGLFGWVAGTNAQPALPQKLLPRAVTVPRTVTNGVQWLRWKPGTAPQQLIISTNRTIVIPDESYLARVSGLATGTKQTYVVTNAAGESNIAIATVSTETNRIEAIGQVYRVPLYPGLTNWLVSSTNLITWQPERILGTNGGEAIFVVTNLPPQKFYRLLAY